MNDPSDEEKETALRQLIETSRELNLEMLVARAQAIQAFANLEQALCALFALVGDMTNRTAATIFFRISAFGSRRKIIDELFRQKFKDRPITAFMASLQRGLAPVEQERNEIVHWTVVNHQRNHSVSISLRPPVFWSRALDPERGDSKDANRLKLFKDKCHFWEIACLKFIDAVNANSGLDQPERASWLDIFQKSLAYPPQEATLLERALRELHSQPQSSLA